VFLTKSENAILPGNKPLRNKRVKMSRNAIRPELSLYMVQRIQ